MDIFCQVWITLTGCVAIWCISRLESWRRWGFVFGLLGQPAWFYTAYVNEQWGIFVLSFWYAYAWAQGFYNHFLRYR